MSQRKALIASILLTLVLAFSAIGIRAAMFDSSGESASTKGALPLLVDDRGDDDRYEDDDEDDRYEHDDDDENDDDGKAYASSYRDDDDDDRYEHEDDDDDDD
jgi:hypothetical protein